MIQSSCERSAGRLTLLLMPQSSSYYFLPADGGPIHTDPCSRAYQEISDDSEPTLATTFGSLLISLRPDRALASKPLDPPRELFKNQ